MLVYVYKTFTILHWLTSHKTTLNPSMAELIFDYTRAQKQIFSIADILW